uniref:Protein TsetseEP domain-containing protein n=1 Tax=Anopheles atroparvus TaxID=41427 RepID=A0AAG5DAV8_ANOAO
MRTFGFALAAVLCAVQLTVALPRPDFGINIEVFSADRTDAVAVGVSVLLNELWNTNPITLNAGYQTLADLVEEIDAIGGEFAGRVSEVFSTISDLANADADVASSFTAVYSAISSLEGYVSTGVSTNFDNLVGFLEDNEIVTMLQDAFGKIQNTLSDLGDALDELKLDIGEVVTEAGSGSITKSLLRSILKPSKTTELTIQVQNLKADLPLVFYILMTTKDLVKMADDYIINSSNVAESAVEYINTGLSALVDEVEGYSLATSNVQAIVTDVSEVNLDFAALDLSTIPAIQSETNHFGETYGVDLQTTITAMTGHFNNYMTDIPTVADGYSNFYENDGCAHIYDIVTVLINFGPYAEYCFEKYGDQGIALFEQNARRANECVDREITRLLKLQEVLVSIAEMLVFSIEDLLQTVMVCVANADYCNDSDIDTYLSDLHSAIDEYHLYDLEDIVDYETDAGLARLNSCFTAAKYGMLVEISELQSGIAYCEANGPNDEI